jgi:hypothetical protein
VSIGPAAPDASLVPPDRSYTFQIHALRPPRAVEHEDGTVLPRGQAEGARAWWHDGERFLFVRLGSGPASARIRW